MTNMKASLGIKGKLLLLIGGASLALGLLATYAVYGVSELRTTIDYLGNQRIPLGESVADLRAASNAVPRFMWLALMSAPGSPERQKALNKADSFIDLWKQSMDRSLTYQMTDKARSKIMEVKELAPGIFEGVEKGKLELLANNDAKAKEILMSQMAPGAVKTTEKLLELSKIVAEKNKAVISESMTGANKVQGLLYLISGFIAVTLISFSYFFATMLSKSLLSITNLVAEASTQVSAASNQLSNAADQLSSASQEQAASTEETSASLTEISGMVEANVQGAENASEHAQEVHAVAEDTRKSMDELKDAMVSIQASNARIEALVKVISEIGEKTEVIDDIVFKTQLLSFNASVEAERAGEHGRGFSVVAQEVGNLAQMSGKAATEIASIVKKSIKEAEEVARENKARVEAGEVLAGETGQKMGKVLSSLSTILEATSKIVAASKEQSQGIGQITTSVDGLNQSTQEIASTAEESASASEELNGQAKSLLSLVQDLRQIVTGAKNESTPDTLKNDHFISESENAALGAKVVPLKKQSTQSSIKVQFKKVSGNSEDLSQLNSEWEKL